jgi:hypothetical protein
MLGGIPPTQRQFVAPRLQLTDDGMLRATTRTGLTITQDRPAKKKSKAPIVLSAVVGVLLVGGGAVFALTRKPPPKEEPSTAAAPATAAPANDKVNVSPVVKRFDLKITVPSGAEVKVDGEKQSVVGGKLELNGSPGSTRKVVIQVGDQVEETTVAITETGLVPPSVEHKAPAPVAAAARPGKARPGPAQAASKPTTAAAESSKPAKKVQVETGMDEFK